MPVERGRAPAGPQPAVDHLTPAAPLTARPVPEPRALVVPLVEPPVEVAPPATKPSGAPSSSPIVAGKSVATPAPAGPTSNGADHGDGERGTTAPQLRRFIKSRAYVPMHELRRRFAINGADDEVTAVDLDRQRVFVGLPEREGLLLGELLRAGDIGYELSMDPISPIVVGVYPMRPVTRA